MFAEVMGEEAYCAYRIHLEIFLQIPTDASDQNIHQLIEAGFSASSVMALYALGTIPPSQHNKIIPLKTLKSRLLHGQRLTTSESDRLFRLIHITAMAEVIFGNHTKAKHWLSKPKESLLGNSPNEMLSTLEGTRLVEERLIQMAEGYAL